MGWLWMVPTADDFEPQKDQIRAYEEIGGGGGREKGIWCHLVLSELLP